MPKDKSEKIICKSIVSDKGKSIGTECYSSCHRGQTLEILTSEEKRIEPQTPKDLSEQTETFKQSAQALQIIKEDFKVREEKKQEQVKQKLDRKVQRNVQKQNVETQLKVSKCGMNALTEVSATTLRCPDKWVAYKYHYYPQCRKIKTFQSDDPIIESKNYSVIFCSRKQLPTITQQEAKKLYKK